MVSNSFNEVVSCLIVQSVKCLVVCRFCISITCTAIFLITIYCKVPLNLKEQVLHVYKSIIIIIIIIITTIIIIIIIMVHCKTTSHTKTYTVFTSTKAIITVKCTRSACETWPASKVVNMCFCSSRKRRLGFQS